MFRYLTADEIDCRVATINNKGLTLLLYKDARVDQNILDETFGVFGWQRTHQLIGDRLYCTVSVKNPETGEWISKQDVGTESYTEKEKGQASDSFKRACFNLGIGRELYTAPFIWIPSDQYSAVEKNGRFTTFDRFRVAAIEIVEGKITYLSIVNLSRKGMQAYEYGRPAEVLPPTTENPVKRITQMQAAAIKLLCGQVGIPEDMVCAYYGIASIDEMNTEQCADLKKNGNARWRA